MLIYLVPWCCSFGGRGRYSTMNGINAVGPVVFIALEVACTCVRPFLNMFPGFFFESV